MFLLMVMLDCIKFLISSEGVNLVLDRKHLSYIRTIITNTLVVVTENSSNLMGCVMGGGKKK